MNNQPKQHGAGPPEARGPMQLHRLHRLKAGPDYHSQLASAMELFALKERLQKHFRKTISSDCDVTNRNCYLCEYSLIQFIL